MTNNSSHSFSITLPNDIIGLIEMRAEDLNMTNEKAFEQILLQGGFKGKATLSLSNKRAILEVLDDTELNRTKREYFFKTLNKGLGII